MELDYGLDCRSFTANQWQQHQGPTLDSQRNCLLDFYNNSLNQNQVLLDSRYVAEETEDNQGFRIGSHGFPFHGGTDGEAAAQPLHPPQKKRSPAGGSSRLGLRNSGGEIVEVQGGHIVRSTGRKDRHSKVCTAKGPRDRRVRLAAHTAIQFYDVQDRLGYDRPSKAVDWLIKKAKTAIDKLADLPAWNPTSTSTDSTSILNFEKSPDTQNTNHRELHRFGQHPNDGIIDNQMGNTQNSTFLPPSLDSDSPPDLLSRSSNQSQDLRLSLQSLKDPILHHHHQTEEGNCMFLDGSGGWPERMAGWGGGGHGDVFTSPATQTTPFLQTLFSQTTNSYLFNNISQRGPLQSSNTPSIRAWIDQPPFDGGAAIDHPVSSMSGFTSGVGGFSGFLIPARFQGEQEEDDGFSDKPSSASSDSRL